MKLSARTLYLSLALCVTLLFTATGIYYLVNSSNQQQINEITIEDRKEIAQAQTTPIPTPISTPIPTPEPTSTPEPIEKSTDTQKLGNFLDDMEKTCYEPCEFSYQCPANLDCIEVNEVKICANPQCGEDTTCTCTATPKPVPTETGIGGIDDQVKGLLTEGDELDDFNEVGEIYDTIPVEEASSTATPKPIPTIKPTPTPTPNNYKVDDLPDAGVPELTILLLLIGVSLSTIGFAWLKK